MEHALLGIQPAHILATLIIFAISIFLWMNRRVERLEKRTWRIERSFVLFVKLMIKEKVALHPEHAGQFSEIEEMVNVILKESDDESTRFKLLGK